MKIYQFKELPDRAKCKVYAEEMPEIVEEFYDYVMDNYEENDFDNKKCLSEFPWATKKMISRTIEIIKNKNYSETAILLLCIEFSEELKKFIDTLVSKTKYIDPEEQKVEIIQANN